MKKKWKRRLKELEEQVSLLYKQKVSQIGFRMWNNGDNEDSSSDIVRCRGVPCSKGRKNKGGR
jgi:hypothetical protein